MQRWNSSKQVIAAGFVAVVLAAPAAWGHGGQSHGRKPDPQAHEEKDFGKAADANKASRTIRVSMSDAMKFKPNEIRAKQGETVKFIVSNDGRIMHEMVIGTMKELKEHADLMKKFPSMEHDEPWMAHVGPGRKEDIVWQFTKPGEFFYACLIPGHFEAGMVGKIVVAAAK